MSEQITFPRDLKVDLRVNPVRFMLDASKKCVVPAENTKFHVIQLESGRELYSADLYPSDCDFGRSAVGDFSKVRVPGTYYIKTDKSRSYPFRINNTSFSVMT